LALFGKKKLAASPVESIETELITKSRVDAAAPTGALIVFSERQLENRSDSDFCSDVYVQLTSHFDYTVISLWPKELRFMLAVLEYSWRLTDGGHEMFLSDESFVLEYEADVIGGLAAISALTYVDLFEQFSLEYHCQARIFRQNRNEVRVAFSKEYLADLDNRAEILNRTTHLNYLIRNYISHSKLFRVVPDIDHANAMRELTLTFTSLSGPNPSNDTFSESLRSTLIALSSPLQRAIFLLCVQAGIEIKSTPDVFHKTINRNHLLGGRKFRFLIDINGHHYLMRLDWQGATLESAERQGFGPLRYLATLKQEAISDLIES
jgi:hypothetical protein